MSIIDAPGLTKAQGDAVIAAATTQANTATTQASLAATQAGIATTQAGAASTAATAAATAKTAAESARDSALIQAGVYTTEVVGRAAVADGVAFKVQGSGNVAAFEYRRVDASTVSTLIATYPSKTAYDTVAEKQKIKADLQVGKNLLNPSDPDVVSGYIVDSTNGNLTVNASYVASGYIPVTGGAAYAFNKQRFMAWYDASKVYISGDSTSTGNPGTLTAPANAAYARISVGSTQLSATQMEAGAVSTVYVPYTPTLLPSQLRDGGVSESKYGAGSVGYRHTKFIQSGKNLFNSVDPDVAIGYFISGIDGTLAANASYNTTGYIPVTGGATYTLSYKNALAWFDASKNFISGSTSSDSNKTQTAPANAVYLRCMVATSSWATYQVEVGSSQTGYVQFSLKMSGPGGVDVQAAPKDGSVNSLKLVNYAVTTEKVAFVNTGKNLFNSVDPGVALGYFVAASDGSLNANAAYNSTTYIPVTGGATYTISAKYQIAWYDASKVYISGDATTNGNPATLTAPASAVYLRCSVGTSKWATFQTETGASATAYDPFKLLLSGPGSVPIQATPTDASVTIAKAVFFQPGKNKFNLGTATLGAYIDATGGQGANSVYDVSDFIAVTPGVTYSAISARYVCYYDANKAVVAGGNNSTSSTFTVPSGVAYARVTLPHTQLATYQIEVGSSPTVFESYWYVLKDPGGLPIRTDNGSLVDTDILTIAAKQYIPYGKEIAVYHENITKSYLSIYRGRTQISFTGGKETGPSTKLIPTSGQVGTTISGTTTVADTDFSTLQTKAFNIIVSDPTKTTSANIQNVGDSFTGRMTWANVILGSAAAAGLTFSGNRNSASSSPVIRCEGQGGWSLLSYFDVDHGGYLSPFMQPVNSGYLYFGKTSFWIDANSAVPSYNAAGFDGIKGQFSASTGRKLAPNVGDVMGDGGGYIQWDGSNWVSIASATFGGFAFSYAKYRQAWSIPSPTILHVLLGTNDFFSATDGTFPSSYTTYKGLYDQLIASVKADTPGVKIIVGVPVSSGRQGKWGTLATEQTKRAYYLLAKALSADYGGREAENIYVLDYHSVVDRFYGFTQVSEKPFNDYTGTVTDTYTSDVVHLGADGFTQMGNSYMGLIQYLR